MDRRDAHNILARCQIVGTVDFHTLNSDTVDCLLAEADRAKYRKPKSANGSRGRYFYALVQRCARLEA